jgi:hypothetical protein
LVDYLKSDIAFIPDIEAVKTQFGVTAHLYVFAETGKTDELCMD